MDIQDIIGRLIQAGGEKPEILENLGINPAEAIKSATGLDLDEDQIGDVLKVVEGATEGEGLNPKGLLDVAGDFLGEGGDLLGKIGGLFSGK